MNDYEITASLSQVAVNASISQLQINVDAGAAGPQGPPGVGSDRNFTQTFTPTTSVTANHNMGKYPSVTVIDSAGDEVEGDVVYLSTNSLIVNFSSAFSGTIILN